MFAVYAKEANPDDPLAALAVGERPEPHLPPDWVRVRISHVSLNRHDVFTLRGHSGHEEGIEFPIILGNDGAGTLDDGTEVLIYPVMGSPDWRGDETLDPRWHILGEFTQGAMADFVAVPRRNALPRPEGLSAPHASVLGTAWLTAYRSLFTLSGLRPGQTLLVQGASGGMATALLQMGRAAGFEVWVTTRNEAGAALAERLGAHRVFRPGEPLPRPVDAVVDNAGTATIAHSLRWVKRGGTVVVSGGTTGMSAGVDLLRMVVDQVTLRGTIMGTLEEMTRMMNFILTNQITPEIGLVAPMSDAREAFAAMIANRTQGKTVLTR
jgi:NADPH:quinone reductase-like Zn-dependent oxidoreductase